MAAVKARRGMRSSSPGASPTITIDSVINSIRPHVHYLTRWLVLYTVRVNEGCLHGRALPQHRGRTVDEDNEVFVGLDAAKQRRHAVAVAGAGRQGEVRYLGEIAAFPASVGQVVARLEKRHAKLHFCYEAEPTGYGLCRQLVTLGHSCIVVAPSLIPRRAGDTTPDANDCDRLRRAAPASSGGFRQ